MLGSIILLVLVAGIFIAFVSFCFYKAYTGSKENQELEEKYEPIYTATFKHTDGLPMSAGAIVKAIYCEDCFVFLKDKQEITVSREKVKSVDLVTGKDIKTQQATGALILGGLSGAVIGSLLATSL